MEALDRIADFAASCSFDTLPAAVIERARWVLRDTVGVIIAGMAEAEVHALAEYAGKTAPGPVGLFNHRGRTTAPWAALVHGTAGTTLEMDEGHAFARGHAAIHAVPTALAMAERHGVSGRKTLVAMVIGYEVAARAGVATQLRSPVHPFGAWGVLGAAAIGAWFKGYKAAQIRQALELAASYAITPSFETAYQGATVRNTYAGMVNYLGLLAADFHELGFRGETGGLETAFGQILGRSFDATALSEGLGDRFEIERGYFKPYSGCRYTHAAIDAVFALQAEEAIEIEAVRAIEVATYDMAAHLTEPTPRTPLAGRFSLPYVVAATLVKGSAGPEIFRPDVLADPGVLNMAGKVSVRESRQFTAMTPAKRPAQVTLHFSDGTQRQKTVFGSKGDPDQPMTAEELRRKFDHLCEPHIGPERTEGLWHALGRIDQWPDLREFSQLYTLEINVP